MRQSKVKIAYSKIAELILSLNMTYEECLTTLAILTKRLKEAMLKESK